MGVYKSKNIDISQFCDMPMAIFKDSCSGGVRTPLIRINDDVILPNRKRLLRSLERQHGEQKPFSKYHFHEGVEILKIDEGTASVVINDEKYTVKAGDILIINPFEAHGIYLTDPQADFMRTCFVFPPSALFPTQKNSDLPFFDMLLNTGFQNLVTADTPLGAELGGYVDSIAMLAQKRADGWQVAVVGQLMMFYAAMIREGRQRAVTDVLPYQFEFVNKVTMFVEENLASQVTTERAAEYCLYSVEHFCRLFKSCFNRTFKEYLNICRIQKAMDLLDDGHYKSIGEVGRQVGFNNANHFSNTFKKMVGVTPSVYIHEKEKET